MDIFNRNKVKALSQIVQEMQLQVSESNQLYNAIYKFLNGSSLSKDKLSNAVEHGYEGNVSCFGIINTLSTIFAKPEDKLFIYNKDKSKTEVEPEEFGITFLTKTNHYQNWTEFKKMWATSYYTNGNALNYAHILEAGNNRGRLIDNQMFIMPAQDVEIYADGWRNPISKYGFNIDGGKKKIEAIHIIHDRFAPNLDYNNGKNFWGVSPVLVALNIIISQNEGYSFLSNTYANRMPPGIFSNDSDYQEGVTEQQRNSFIDNWKKKYRGKKADQMPIFVNRGNYQKIGFDSMRDLQVLETQADGARQLATSFGVPSQIFNDIAGTTYANQSEAFKRLISLRTEPDWNVFYESLHNERLKYYHPDLWLEPDLSKISEMIKNLEMVAKVYDIGVKNKAISKNEFRQALGLETLNELGMDDVGDNVLDSFPTLQQTTDQLNDL